MAAARALFRVPSTGPGDPGRRVDFLEQSVVRLAEDAEKAADAGGKWRVVRMSANGPAAPWDFVLANPTAAAFQVLIPDPRECALAELLVKNDSASVNAITVKPPNGRTIDGAASLVMSTARLSKRLKSDGLEWKETASSAGALVGPYVIQDGTDANTTALANVLLRMPTVTALRTVSMPASPTNGTWVKLKLNGGVTAFTLTISGNGKNIFDGFTAAASTYSATVDGWYGELVYSLAQDQWMLL